MTNQVSAPWYVRLAQRTGPKLVLIPALLFGIPAIALVGAENINQHRQDVTPGWLTIVLGCGLFVFLGFVCDSSVCQWKFGADIRNGLIMGGRGLIVIGRVAAWIVVVVVAISFLSSLSLTTFLLVLILVAVLSKKS